jgi:hypothetical protein
VCLGIAHSEVRNETEYRENFLLKVIHVLFFVLDGFGMSFQRCFLSLNGSDEISSVFSSTKLFGTEFRAIFIFRGMAQNGIPSIYRSVK